MILIQSRCLSSVYQCYFLNLGVGNTAELKFQAVRKDLENIARRQASSCTTWTLSKCCSCLFPHRCPPSLLSCGCISPPWGADESAQHETEWLSSAWAAGRCSPKALESLPTALWSRCFRARAPSQCVSPECVRSLSICYRKWSATLLKRVSKAGCCASECRSGTAPRSC